MKLKEMVLKNRSYRRFYQDVEIPTSDLREFVDLARLSPSPRNRQALKFIIENRPEHNAYIFEQLAWAAALPNWSGPDEGERPSAYIIILGDNSLDPPVTNAFHEAAYGIAAQTILLAATEKGFGGCMIAAIKRKAVQEHYNIDQHLQILLVIALGKPKEEVELYEIEQNESYNYSRDEKGTHHVPKRRLDDIIVKTNL